MFYLKIGLIKTYLPSIFIWIPSSYPSFLAYYYIIYSIIWYITTCDTDTKSHTVELCYYHNNILCCPVYCYLILIVEYYMEYSLYHNLSKPHSVEYLPLYNWQYFIPASLSHSKNVYVVFPIVPFNVLFGLLYQYCHTVEMNMLHFFFQYIHVYIQSVYLTHVQ